MRWGTKKTTVCSGALYLSVIDSVYCCCSFAFDGRGISVVNLLILPYIKDSQMSPNNLSFREPTSNDVIARDLLLRKKA